MRLQSPKSSVNADGTSWRSNRIISNKSPRDLMETLKYSIVLLAALIALIMMSATPNTALAAAAESLDKLPDNATIEKLELVPVGISYLDSLIATASGLNDYQCYCELAVLKNNHWKSYGGANLFFKQREKIRAEIVSSDYRNGSVV